MKDLGAVVSFKGYYGDLAIVVAKTSYVAEDGTEKRYLPEGTLVLGNTAAEGIRCYGAIQDAQALSEGVVASSRYPKHWLTVGDPAREFTMTQSAPLMVLPDPDEFVVVQVEIIRERGRNAPVSFSQGADMATKEENLNRLRQLAGLLGREADISGSAADMRNVCLSGKRSLLLPGRALCLVMRAGLSKITQTMVSSCTTLMLRMMLKRFVCGNACM